MAIYKTGRQRTLSYTAALAGLFAEQFTWGVLEDAPPPHAAAGSVVLTAPWGASVMVQIASRDDTIGSPHPIGYADFDAGALLSVNTGLTGGTASINCWNEDNRRVNSGEYWNWSWNWSGSALMSLEVEECIELSAPDSINSSGFVTHGGSAIDDMPAGLKVRLFERAKTHGVCTSSLWVGSCAVTASSTVTPGSEFDVSGYTLTHHLRYTSVLNNTATMSAIGQFNGIALTAPYSKSLSGSSASASSGAAITCSSSDSTPKSASLTASIAPPKSYDLAGVIRRWNEPYPDNFLLQIDRKSGASAQDLTASSGAFADAVSQKKYTCSSVLNGVAQDSLTLDEWLDLRLWIKGAALAEKGEDARDWRIFLHGRAYDAITLYEPGTAVFDDGSGTAVIDGMVGYWQAVENVTLSSTGGKIQAIVAGGEGRFQRVFDPPGLLRDYRFLRIVGEVDSGTAPFRVRCGAKEWINDWQGSALTLPAAGGTVWIDLCGPTNAAISVDSYDTRYPLPTDVNTVSGNGALYGVHNAGTLTVEGLTNGRTYRIDSLALARAISPPFGTAGWSRAVFLPAFDDWTLQTAPVVSGDVTTYTYVRRFLTGDTDGKQSLEEIDAIKTVVVSSSGTVTTYTQRTIEDIVEDINLSNHPAESYAIRLPGWMSSLASGIDVADGANYSHWGTAYLNRNRPATWLYGAGALWQSSGCSYGIDIDCGTAQTIRAQMLFDQINWYPGVGDPFYYAPSGTAGAYGTALIIRASKILRGQGRGICFENDMRHGSAVVSAIDTTDSSSAGGGTSVPFGCYQTSTPYGRGSRTIQVSALSLNYTRLWRNRRYHRVSFRAGAGGADWLSLDVSLAGRMARAYVAGGTVQAGISQDVIGITWYDISTGISGSTPCLRYDRWNRGQPLYLQVCQSGTVKLYVTMDEGDSWSYMQTIGAGSFNTFFVNEDGRQFHYYLRGGTIYGVILDAVGGTIVSEFAAISGADSDAIAAHRVYINQGGMRVKLLYTQGGNIISATSADGETFI